LLLISQEVVSLLTPALPKKANVLCANIGFYEIWWEDWSTVSGVGAMGIEGY
jgi:hypothetical protein